MKHEQCAVNGELAESMKQGLISLIPKPNKELEHLDNSCPITLFNSDYKIISIHTFRETQTLFS